MKRWALKMGTRTLGTYEFFSDASAAWDAMGRPVASIVRLP